MNHPDQSEDSRLRQISQPQYDALSADQKALYARDPNATSYSLASNQQNPGLPRIATQAQYEGMSAAEKAQMVQDGKGGWTSANRGPRSTDQRGGKDAHGRVAADQGAIDSSRASRESRDSQEPLGRAESHPKRK